VPTSAPGYRAAEIRNKVSLRASVSTNLLLDNVRVPASALLPLARGLKAPLSCLDEARFGIVWGLAGAARTCYGAALDYAGSRHQFGQPIAGFQLTQRKLATMVVELSHSGLTALRLAQLKRAGTLTPEQISLGKLANADSAIKVARCARTILGANGITLTHPVARHLANLDAVLTVEGTEEVHQLIIGRAVTGIQAFR
jgi:glutaryl-CoA dehydrogenase